jgi:acyl dehydratase
MSVQVEPVVTGAVLPALELPEIDREVLRRYADASGDHAPIHLDTDIARANGFPDVIAHGLLVMGYLGRAVGEWFPERTMQDFSCRFMAVTLLGDRLRCSGRVAAVDEAAGSAELELQVADQRGEIKLKGSARVVR